MKAARFILIGLALMIIGACAPAIAPADPTAPDPALACIMTRTGHAVMIQFHVLADRDEISIRVDSAGVMTIAGQQRETFYADLGAFTAGENWRVTIGAPEPVTATIYTTTGINDCEP